MRNLITLILVSAVALFLAGCSTFTKPDGSTETRPDPVKIEAAGTAAATVASTVIPPPLGQTIGLAVGAIATALAAYYGGTRKGWDEAVGTPAKPGEAK